MSILSEISHWLAVSPLNHWVTAYDWFVPAIQVVHILAIAVVVVAAVQINLPALGFAGTGQAVSTVTRRWLPIIGWAVGVLALTGFLLIASEPGRALFRAIFWIKLVLVVLAVAITALQLRPANGATVTRLLAIAGLLAWVAVIYAGRWIAYANAWSGAAS